MLWQNIDNDHLLSPAQLLEAIAQQINYPEGLAKAQELRERELWIEAAGNVLERYEERRAIQLSEPDRFYRWSNNA